MGWLRPSLAHEHSVRHEEDYISVFLAQLLALGLQCEVGAQSFGTVFAALDPRIAGCNDKVDGSDWCFLSETAVGADSTREAHASGIRGSGGTGARPAWSAGPSTIPSLPAAPEASAVSFFESGEVVQQCRDPVVHIFPGCCSSATKASSRVMRLSGRLVRFQDDPASDCPSLTCVSRTLLCAARGLRQGARRGAGPSAAGKVSQDGAASRLQPHTMEGDPLLPRALQAPPLPDQSSSVFAGAPGHPQVVEDESFPPATHLLGQAEAGPLHASQRSSEDESFPPCALQALPLRDPTSQILPGAYDLSLFAEDESFPPATGQLGQAAVRSLHALPCSGEARVGMESSRPAKGSMGQAEAWHLHLSPHALEDESFPPRARQARPWLDPTSPIRSGDPESCLFAEDVSFPPGAGLLGQAEARLLRVPPDPLQARTFHLPPGMQASLRALEDESFPPAATPGDLESCLIAEDVSFPPGTGLLGQAEARLLRVPPDFLQARTFHLPPGMQASLRALEDESFPPAATPTGQVEVGPITAVDMLHSTHAPPQESCPGLRRGPDHGHTLGSPEAPDILAPALSGGRLGSGASDTGGQLCGLALLNDAGNGPPLSGASTPSSDVLPATATVTLQPEIPFDCVSFDVLRGPVEYQLPREQSPAGAIAHMLQHAPFMEAAWVHARAHVPGFPYFQILLMRRQAPVTLIVDARSFEGEVFVLEVPPGPFSGHDIAGHIATTGRWAEAVGLWRSSQLVLHYIHRPWQPSFIMQLFSGDLISLSARAGTPLRSVGQTLHWRPDFSARSAHIPALLVVRVGIAGHSPGVGVAPSPNLLLALARALRALLQEVPHLDRHFLAASRTANVPRTPLPSCDAAVQ